MYEMGQVNFTGTFQGRGAFLGNQGGTRIIKGNNICITFSACYLSQVMKPLEAPEQKVPSLGKKAGNKAW